MKRLLLLVTSTTYKAQAFLDAASRLDVAVTVGTDRRQVLSDLDPTGNLTLDFDSPEAAAGDIVAFARRHWIDAVLAADDEGVLLAAHAARALGLRHNSVHAVGTARDKRRTRAALRDAGLPTPHTRTLSLDADPAEFAAGAAYPCVLKPVALSASRGVMRADDPQGFVRAFHRLAAILHSPDVLRRSGDLAREILVEDFIPGIEVALEGVLSNGGLRVLALFDKPDPLDGPFFEETIYVTPSRHPAEVQADLVSMAAGACAALGLRQGPVHAELRWNARGAWLLEAAPRSIGGLCSRALRFGDGSVSLEELLLRHALGLDTAALGRETLASGVMMIPIPRAGVLRAVRGTEAAAAVSGIDGVQITIPPGQAVAPPPEGARYLGFLFAHAAEPAAVETALRASHARLDIEITAPAVSGAPAPEGESHAPVHG